MSDHGHELGFGIFITPSNEDAVAVVEMAQRAEDAGLDLVSFQAVGALEVSKLEIERLISLRRGE